MRPPWSPQKRIHPLRPIALEANPPERPTVGEWLELRAEGTDNPRGNSVLEYRVAEFFQLVEVPGRYRSLAPTSDDILYEPKPEMCGWVRFASWTFETMD